MKRKTKIALGVLLALTSPWWLWAVYLGGRSVYGRIDEYIYRPSSAFDIQKWSSGNKKYRYSVLDTVKNRIITPGMNQSEVKRILGGPDEIERTGGWQYETRRPGWRLIDFSGGGLLIQFDESGRIRSTTVNTWVD